MSGWPRSSTGMQKHSPDRREGTVGILRLDLGKPRRSSGGSVDFRGVPDRLGSQGEPPSPQPSIDRLSVTFKEKSDCSESSVKVNIFDPGSPPSQLQDMEKVRFSKEKPGDADDEEDDYSASVRDILQRRESTRRSSSKRRKRRPSSPFSGCEGDSAISEGRRRSSVFTNSSGETAISVEEGTTQEQIFENIKLHKEVLGNVKLQPWPMRRKIKLVQQAKAYVKRHEGELQERLALSKSTKDILARFNILFVKKLQFLRREMANTMTVLIPWELRIKEIESHFGSAVASYFVFLRWMFWVNLVITVVLTCFVAIPELLTADVQKAGERKELLPDEKKTAMNLLTLWDFEGILKYSVIFYGYYTNEPKTKTGYRLPFAYFMTGLAVYVYSFVATLRRMAENSRMSKLSEKDDECAFTWKLFSGWDYMIGNAETAHNRVASIVLGFKESLLEETEKKKDEKNWKVTALRVLANFFVLVLLVISAYIVFVVVERSTQPNADNTWWRQNEITVSLSIISIIFPMMFELLGLMEGYHPRKCLRVQLARIMVLNLLTLYTLIFSLFWKIGDMTEELKDLKTMYRIPEPEPFDVTPPTTVLQSELPKVTSICYRIVVSCARTTTSPTITSSTAVAAMVSLTAYATTVTSPPDAAGSYSDYYDSIDSNEDYDNINFMPEYRTTEMTSFTQDFTPVDINATVASLTKGASGYKTSMIPYFVTIFKDIFKKKSERPSSSSTKSPVTTEAETKGRIETETDMKNKSTTDQIKETTSDHRGTTADNRIPTTTGQDTGSSPDFNGDNREVWHSGNKEIEDYPADMAGMSSSSEDPSNICYDTACVSVKAETTTETPSTTTEEVTTGADGLPEMNMETRKRLRTLCWETMFGQELVKLTVMDLVLTVVSTLLVDFFRAVFVRVMNNCWCWDLEKQFPQYGDFKIAENILHLVNNQGMVWMGMFFSPGLPAINLVKLAIMMYLRSWAVLTCNVPHEVVFKASRSNNFYLALLLTMLFLCVLPVGFAIVWIEPSWHCGPFSNYKKIYHLFTQSLQKALPKSMHKALDYIASPGIIIPLLMLLVLIIYYLLSLTSSLREANNDLKMQLRRERTEERRKMFQLVDKRARKGSGDSENVFAKWKKLLPDLSPKPSLLGGDVEKGEVVENGNLSADPKKDNNRKELLSRLMKRALRKSSGTSDDDSPLPEDTHDADQMDSPFEDLNSRPKKERTGRKEHKVSSLIRASQRLQDGKGKKSPTSQTSTQRNSLASEWSENIPVIKISKTESEECIIDTNQKKIAKTSPKKSGRGLARFKEVVKKQISNQRKERMTKMGKEAPQPALRKVKPASQAGSKTAEKEDVKRRLRNQLKSLGRRRLTETAAEKEKDKEKAIPTSEKEKTQAEKEPNMQTELEEPREKSSSKEKVKEEKSCPIAKEETISSDLDVTAVSPPRMESLKKTIGEEVEG